MLPDRSGPDRARPLDDVEEDRWAELVGSLRGGGTVPQRHRTQRARTGLAEVLRPRNPLVEGALLLLLVVVLVPDPVRPALLAVGLLVGLPAVVVVALRRAADLLERLPDPRDGGR